jgi:peroxiredoxin
VSIRTYLILGLGLAVAVSGCSMWRSKPSTPGVAPSSTTITPALIGTRVPEIDLYGPDGKLYNLKDVFAQQPTVLVIYRGNWCVYCQKQLADLQRIEPDLIALGYQIVAVSPDQPTELKKNIEGQNLKYRLLSDPYARLATSLGVSFYVDDETRRELEVYGWTPTNVEAQPQWTLPVPAVFLVSPTGIVTWEYVNPDYRQRVSSDVLLAAAKAEAARTAAPAETPTAAPAVTPPAAPAETPTAAPAVTPTAAPAAMPPAAPAVTPTVAPALVPAAK